MTIVDFFFLQKNFKRKHLALVERKQEVSNQLKPTCPIWYCEIYLPNNCYIDPFNLLYSTDHVSFFSNIIFYVCNRGRGQSHPHPRKLYLPKLYFDTLQASKTSRHLVSSKTTHINHEPSRHTNRNPSEFKASPYQATQRPGEDILCKATMTK